MRGIFIACLSAGPGGERRPGGVEGTRVQGSQAQAPGAQMPRWLGEGAAAWSPRTSLERASSPSIHVLWAEQEETLGAGLGGQQDRGISLPW